MADEAELRCVGACRTGDFFAILGETYDRYRPSDDAATRNEIDEVLAASGAGGGVALDLMCGQGRHSLELARRGWRVVAVDRVPALLDLLRERSEADGTGHAVETLLGDVNTADLPGDCDLVMLLGNTFGFASDRDESGELLRRAGSSLADGGVLVVETFRPSAREEKAMWTRPLNGGSITKLREWDPDRSVEHMAVEIRRGDASTYTCYQHYLPGVEEFTQLAGEAGLACHRATSLSSDADLFVATKKARR